MRLKLYILGLLFRNLVFLFVVTTGLLFLVAVGGTIAGQIDIPISTLISRFPYLLPLALPKSLPLSFLAATVLTYARLASGNEILAIRAAGIHLVHVVLPAVLLALVLVAMNLYVTGNIAPRAELKAREVTEDDLRNFLDTLSQQRVHRFVNRQVEMTWTTVDDEDWLHDLYFEFKPEGMERIRGEAARAKISRDRRSGELLFDLREVTVARGEFEDRVSAPKKLLAFDVEGLFGSRSAKCRREHFTSGELRMITERDPLLGLPEDDWGRTKFRMEYWSRISLSLSCLLFALTGAPVGILFRRGSFVGAALVSIVIGFGLYFPLHQLAVSLTLDLVLPPPLAFAIPFVTLAALGIYLLHRVFGR